MDISRVMETLEILNRFGNRENGIFRLAYTNEEQEASQFFTQKCLEIGMTVRTDEVGNIIARREGLDDSLPAVVIGSHLDTVYSGGRFDGVLGVVAGLEIVRTLAEEGITTLHPIEVISFACEESSRFNFSTLGSKAMIGDLNLESLQLLKDREEITLEDALKKSNLILENYQMAERKSKEIKVFFELHIEQGSKLIENGKTIGLVTGVAAPIRLAVKIEGKSSHSGTTSMKERKDALLAAAELSLAVEEAALAESEYDTVATVGVLDVQPGAMNIVPGLAQLKIDIRSIDINSRNRVLEKIKEEMAFIQEKRSVSISTDWTTEEAPVMMDHDVTKKISFICNELGLSYMFMPSGAGHDSMNMAKSWASSLVFVPSVDGLSHHPDEFTDKVDIAAGVKLLEEAVKAHAIIVDEEGESSWKHVKSKSSQM